jgi:hypothetical protein
MRGYIKQDNYQRQAFYLKNRFAEETKTNPAFTMDYTGNTVQLKAGYAVGLYTLRTDRLDDYMTVVAVTPDHYLGYWEGQSDLVRVLEDREEALRTAMAFNQVAIYDFANQEVIYVTPGGAQAV